MHIYASNQAENGTRDIRIRITDGGKGEVKKRVKPEIINAQTRGEVKRVGRRVTTEQTPETVCEPSLVKCTEKIRISVMAGRVTVRRTATERDASPQRDTRDGNAS